MPETESTEETVARLADGLEVGEYTWHHMDTLCPDDSDSFVEVGDALERSCLAWLLEGGLVPVVMETRRHRPAHLAEGYVLLRCIVIVTEPTIEVPL